MDRRKFVAGAAVGLLALPRAVRVQTLAVPIAVESLDGPSAAAFPPLLSAFPKALT
jgi:hypothetical protein